MPQERGLYRDMRVLDQLVWIARLHGLDAATGRRRALDLLERLGLAERAKDEVEKLSGGMAQRVQLAAAIVHGPELLVLDEPFNGLDPVAVEFLSTVIVDHVRSGRHLLFSSHQLDLVEDLCEEITMIHHGHVVLHGDVRELKAQSPDRYLRVDVAVDPTWVDPALASVRERGRLGHPRPPAARRGRRQRARRDPLACSRRRLRRARAEPVGAVPRRSRRASRGPGGRRPDPRPARMSGQLA